MTMRFWARARFNLECKLYVEVSRVGLVSQGFGAAKSRSTDLGADGGAFLQQFVLGGKREELLSGQVNLSKSRLFLPVDQAFALSADIDAAGAARFGWDVAEGYYLYRHQFSVSLDGERLQSLPLPEGKAKFDEFFGDVEVYYQFVAFTLPAALELNDGAQLTVGYQGCADRGLCYPRKKTLYFRCWALIAHLCGLYQPLRPLNL